MLRLRSAVVGRLTSHFPTIHIPLNALAGATRGHLKRTSAHAVPAE